MNDTAPLVSAWLGVADGRLVVRSGKVEIGQRISTVLVEIAHEELTVPRHLIEVAPVSTHGSPNEGMTAGSTSVEQGGQAVRRAAATLRIHAIAIAAERTGSQVGEWTLTDGILRGPGRNRPIPLLDFAEDLDLQIPVDPDAVFLPPKASPAASPMRGIDGMVTGGYRFLHDMELPGMLHARVVRPPNAHACLISINQSTADTLAGLGMTVVRDGSFVAVVGAQEWQVVKAAIRLAGACSWDTSRKLTEDNVDSLLTRSNARRMIVKDDTPLPDEAIPQESRPPDHGARYLRPFTMHASLAPSAAIAVWDGGKLSIITHSQGMHGLRNSIASCFGLEPGQVELTYAPSSGCYGHNGADDAAFEAALLARALPGKPILLKWTREEEHCWEPYGAPQAVEIGAWLDENGPIERIGIEAIGGTHTFRPIPGPGTTGYDRLLANRFRDPPILPPDPLSNLGRKSGIRRNLEPCYDFPELSMIKSQIADLPHRTSALRGLGSVPNIFAIECFMDEMARIQGQDPLEFRRRYLNDERALEVIDRLDGAMADAGRIWNSDGRGVAYAQYKNEATQVAVGVFLSVLEDASVQLDHAIIVADAGRVIDLHGLEAQMEGGFLQGASWALHEAVAWDRDGILSRDWDSYPVLRFDNVPEIETTIINRPECRSRGAGEASSGPAVAAIANAVFDATGLRLRHLPITAEAIRTAALEHDVPPA